MCTRCVAISITNSMYRRLRQIVSTVKKSHASRPSAWVRRNLRHDHPRPRVVVVCGDCALGASVFGAGYGCAGGVRAVAGPDRDIPGCPPDPAAITQALRTLTGR
jgi:formate hydrogenlyase subunit 7